MEGESEGRSEDPLSTVALGKAANKCVTESGTMAAPGAAEANDPRRAVERAAEAGLLDGAQARALTDLVSRLSLLGFEAGRIVTVMVNNIASERSAAKRKEIALQLTEYLEGDGLAKDLVPRLSESFSLR